MTYKNKNITSRVQIVVLILIGAIYVAHCLIIFNWYMDDAFISQVYARTLASTGVFANSPGDAPHYGISNPLWVFILAIGHLLNVNAYVYEKILCMLFGLATIYLTWHYIRRLSIMFTASNTALSLAPAFLLSMSWNYAAWSVGGLETIFYAFLIVWALLSFSMSLIEKRFPYAAILLSGMIYWVRPEGIFMPAALAIFFLPGMYIFNYPKGKTLRYFSQSVALTIIILLSKALIMWLLTGALLPSTYYIKAGHIDHRIMNKGFLYLKNYLYQTGVSYPLFAFLLPVVYTVLNIMKRDMRKPVFIIAMLWVICAGYVLFFIVPVGGDWMLGSRFFVHLYPVMAVLMAFSAMLISSAVGEPVFKKIILAIVFISAIQLGYFEIKPTNEADNSNGGYFLKKVWFQFPDSMPSYPDSSNALVVYLNENLNSESTIAMTEGGFFPYYFKGRSFDLHGWSRQELAVVRFNEKHWNSAPFVMKVLEYKPDIILLSGYDGSGTDVQYRLSIEKALTENTVFRQNYKLVKVFENIDEIYRYPYEPKTGRMLNYFVYRLLPPNARYNSVTKYAPTA